MDRITKSLLDDFVQSFSLHALSEDRAFEAFTAYSILSRELADSFELDDVLALFDLRPWLHHDADHSPAVGAFAQVRKLNVHNFERGESCG